MCKVEMLRALLSQRLNAAVEEILLVFERTIAEYEDELCRTKEENERQRQLLDALFKKPTHLPDVSEEDLHGERPEREEPEPEPEPPYIKVEEEGGHPPGSDFSVYRVVVKSEDDEDRGQREESGAAEPPGGSSAFGRRKRSAARRRSQTAATPRPTPTTSAPKGTCFTFQSALFQHMETHFGEKPQCPQCDKTFGNKRNLIRHMRRHTGEKPCVCSFCGERFSLKRSLIRHIRTHIGEKTFSCTVCNTTFCYQSGLSKHMKKHAGEKAEVKCGDVA
ncbi:zinc finger protein 771-like [Syngnathoides biaculeatus]|uniref:zinc finger protein 771-like n=1 Tax=Syngnathoides biaculeatus TaxID=300417 RepID=UPI002ADE4A53|nr:zinc finger protein 771-like [Syngnathoides biaculeatus]